MLTSQFRPHLTFPAQTSFDHSRTADDDARDQEESTEYHRDTLRVVQSIKASVLHRDMLLRRINQN